MLSNTLLLSFFTLGAYAAVHTVDVGKSGLAFSPITLNPKVGDVVIFQLYPQHNVATGSFSSACQPSTNGTSFFSGPFSGTDNGNKRFVVNVTSTNPVYYYCAVPNHCKGGMVGGWNLPSSGNDINAYASAASSASSASAPSALAGGSLVDAAQLASITASGAVASSTATGSATSSRASATSSSSTRSGNSAMQTGVSGAMALGMGVAALIL